VSLAVANTKATANSTAPTHATGLKHRKKNEGRDKQSNMTIALPQKSRAMRTHASSFSGKRYYHRARDSAYGISISRDQIIRPSVSSLKTLKKLAKLLASSTRRALCAKACETDGSFDNSAVHWYI
jgi:hypothetical protein